VKAKVIGKALNSPTKINMHNANAIFPFILLSPQ